jgi:hypothetical protein
MYAEFKSDAATGKVCSCCQYRQEIMGSLQYRATGAIDWIPVHPKIANNKRLSETEYLEDGNNKANGAPYGHRDLPDSDADRYAPLTEPRTTACYYYGYDAPGIGHLKDGVEYIIDLYFRGTIIDKDGKVIDSREWPVYESNVV